MAKKKKDNTISLLQDQMDAISKQIKDAYERFDQADDDYLIDACIYEINAYKAHYNYLLRQVKALQGYPIPRPHAVPVERRDTACVAAASVKGGEICPL